MEKMWYYVVGGTDKAGPVPEDELRKLISSGEVQPDALVWAEGMGEWEPASKFPELTSAAPASAAADVAGAVPLATAAPVAAAYGKPAGGAPVPEGLCGWMTFVGVLNIIQGAFSCISCIGAIVGIPMILAGAAIMSGKAMLQEMGQVSLDMLPFLEKLKRFMVMTGVVFIIGLVGFLLYMVFIIIMIMGGGFAAAMGEM